MEAGRGGEGRTTGKWGKGMMQQLECGEVGRRVCCDETVTYEAGGGRPFTSPVLPQVLAWFRPESAAGGGLEAGPDRQA
eukprot:358929-Chlamydomonas_euryale.AAC.3